MPRKVVKKGKGSKILGSLSPLYGIATGKGAFGKLAKAGLSPAGMLAKKMKKNRQTPVAATARAMSGGSLKAAPAGNTGLAQLPTEVRNKMGYMANGGKVKKMGMGGSTCKGMGAAVRGGNFNRNG